MIQISTAFISGPGYLSPLVVNPSIIVLNSASSSSVNTTSRDAQFSSRRGIVFVPGIGMISVPWAATQASASWAGVMFFFAAMAVNFSTIYVFRAGYVSKCLSIPGKHRHLQIMLEILFGETGMMPTPIIRFKIIVGLVSSLH